MRNTITPNNNFFFNELCKQLESLNKFNVIMYFKYLCPIIFFKH